MKKKLEMLEELQEIDQMIDTLKDAQIGLQAELDTISGELESARAEVQVVEERLALLEQQKGELDTNHSAELDNIARSETNMKEIKTNKEFQAVGREITAARKQVTELEELVLQKIAQIDEITGELTTRKSQLVELEENSAQRTTEKQAEIARVQKDMDADSARRGTLTQQMPASLAKRYDTLRVQRRGRALAIAREGYCQGCNMHLPPQLYNNLFKCDELLTCPHCQRILILKQQQA